VALFPSNICIVDDDADFAEFVAEYLRVRGCACSVFNSAEELMETGRIESFDFFVLDLGLPGIDGTDLTAIIRGRNLGGILVVSGRLGADAFNSALAAGADMFVNKPVRFDQVTHAVSSIWRRFSEPHARTAPWKVVHNFSELISPTELKITLTPIEGKLIQKLTEKPQAVVSRADLARAAGISGSTDYRNLDATLFRLRRKIERELGRPSPFRTVHGVGFQISETVEIALEAEI
jgi:two-component system OmpR family response regulator